MASLVRETDNYGATHDDERVVSLATMDPNNRTNSNTHPTGNPSWNTKKFLLGIMGLTAAVASGASLFLSIMGSSGRQARTEPSFLLHASVGADDNNCVVASGPWPGFKNVKNDDDNTGPYVTCFYNTNGALYAPASHCWSHSYYDSGDWKPCTPNGFGAQGWEFATYGDTDGCGTPCTEFSSGL